MARLVHNASCLVVGDLFSGRIVHRSSCLQDDLSGPCKYPKDGESQVQEKMVKVGERQEKDKQKSAKGRGSI